MHDIQQNPYKSYMKYEAHTCQYISNACIRNNSYPGAGCITGLPVYITWTERSRSESAQGQTLLDHVLDRIRFSLQDPLRCRGTERRHNAPYLPGVSAWSVA